MKAQTSFEYLVVVTTLIAIVVPMFFYANQSLETARVATEARTAMNTIVSSIHTVYSQSPGSKISVMVYIPTGYTNTTSYVDNRTVSMTYTLMNGQKYYAIGLTKCNVTGRVPPRSGYQVITFYHNASGRVIMNSTVP